MSLIWQEPPLPGLQLIIVFLFKFIGSELDSLQTISDSGVAHKSSHSTGTQRRLDYQAFAKLLDTAQLVKLICKSHDKAQQGNNRNRHVKPKQRDMGGGGGGGGGGET